MRPVPVFRRACGLVLLLLALLPVTAPFSTLDLADFFRGTPADAASLHQAKTGGDKPALAAAASVKTEVWHLIATAATRLRVPVQPPHLLDIPLRL